MHNPLTRRTVSRLRGLFVTSVLSVALMAQTTFRSESNLVLVPTLVTDAKGSPVFGIPARDFAIDDNGIHQNVQLEEDLEHGPVSLVVAIQTGRSADAESRRMYTLPTMLEPLIRSAHMQVALVQFDSQVQLIQDFTGDANRVTQKLQSLRPGDGGAAILNALSYSADLLNQVPKGRQRVLLLISETRDHGSRAVQIEDVVRAIGISDTLVFALAFSPTVSSVVDDLHGEMEAKQNSLTQLLIQSFRKNIPKTVAAMTGGEYHLFKSKRSFEAGIVELTNHLFSRYLLSFVPNSPVPGLHSVRVRVQNRGDLHILARTSYWAKDQKR
jgi:VWFA-related protein